MKLTKLLKKYYIACLSHKKKAERNIFNKLLRKSLKQKRTHSAQ